ncbi:hypothetical protein HPB47_012621 [Ixodes persulcatus]|uniref:Uncharacterized protein n=1 Tax=Ixodes persulcatus TaxID=34615 RepID=A0AC60NT09_IXOPE|nr:hypothetical protein HPB47_012621 [Ixodes persulcatus]
MGRTRVVRFEEEQREYEERRRAQRREWRAKRAVMTFLENVENWNSNLNSGSQDSDEDICEMIRLLLAKLSVTSTVDKVHIIQFLTEQLKLLLEKKEQRRYSADCMVFCCLFFTISPHAYNQGSMFWMIANCFVTLMVDEIHIKPYYDYKGATLPPLFFVIDSVHILKCIRNNWLNQGNDRHVFYFPEFQVESTRERHMLSASFATIREAYNLECDQLLRYGHSLSRKALCPSNIERQNVKLALQIFNDSLPPALRSIGVKHNLLHYEGTASFIEIIVKWWKIVNVKAPNKGRRLNDDFQNPVIRYCFEELGLNYVLLGKIQTDGLEDRFGKYRQLAGSQYHVYIRQIYEGENKLRLQSTLPMITTAGEDKAWEGLLERVDTPRPTCNVVVTREALSKIAGILPVLVYVAGYAVYATLKKLKCEECKAALTEDNKLATVSLAQEHYALVKELDRGGLVFPTMFAANAVAHNYVVVEQVSSHSEFLKMPNQRQLVTELTVELLANEDTSDFDTCDNGHTSLPYLSLGLHCHRGSVDGAALLYAALPGT